MSDVLDNARTARAGLLLGYPKRQHRPVVVQESMDAFDALIAEHERLTEDPGHAEYLLRRANVDLAAARQKIEAFEHVFAAFDELRRTGYVPTDYTPQWRNRALFAEAKLTIRDATPVTDAEVVAVAKRLFADDISTGWGDNAPAIFTECERIARAALEAARATHA